MSLDADLFIHPSDKAAMATLKAIPGFLQVMKAFMKVWNEQQFKIINMSTNLRLSERQMKKYYDMLPPVCEKLGIEVPELYVKLDVNPNAYTYGDTKPFIVITSGLFETLPDELIPSVIAHECGHIACHHALYTTMGRALLNGASFFTTGLGNIALYPIQLAFSYWMRCSEFSADRAAMIYDGNADHVIGTMMRFAGYDKDIIAEANTDLFLEQARDYKGLVDGNAWNKSLEFIMFKDYDHPLNAVRALEAHEWEKTERFKTIKSYLEAPTSVKLPVKVLPDKYIGKKVAEAEEKMQNLGFENITLQRASEVDGKVKVGCVAKVIINGEEITENDYYLSDAAIALVYYKPKTEEEIMLEHPGEIMMTENSKSYIGKHYVSVISDFEELGFKNIEAKEMAIPKIGLFVKKDTVAKIIINGVEHFEKGTWYNPDSLICVYYYVTV